MSSDSAGLSALQIATLAGGLLVVLVGLDVAFGVTTSLEIQTDDGWETLATVPGEVDRHRRPGDAIEVNRSDEVEFRVVVDNQRPLGFDEAWSVSTHGADFADGRLTAGVFDQAQASFTVSGEELLDDPHEDGDLPRPTGTSLELQVGEDTTFAHPGLREVAR